MLDFAKMAAHLGAWQIYKPCGIVDLGQNSPFIALTPMTILSLRLLFSILLYCTKV